MMPRPVDAVGAAAGAALLAMLAACDAGPGPASGPDAELRETLRTKYEEHFQKKRPNRVVITTPDGRTMPPAKEIELAVLRDVLARLGIDHEVRRRNEVLATVTVKKKEHPAFMIPDNMPSGTQVLFLNLDAADLTGVIKHPQARERNITVQTWNDPVRIGTARP
jgi:hypothetical protein